MSNEAVYVQLYCSTGAPADCSFASTKPLIARGVEVELFENVPPQGTIGSGTLLKGAAASGRHTLDYSASDSESGVARVEALLGSTVVGSEDFAANATACPHRAFNACASEQSGSIAVDTALVPDGIYVLGLRITDAAETQTTIRGSSVEIRNAGAPAAATSTSASARLTANFLSSGRRTHTVAFGRVVAIGGRLTDRDGAPIPGVEVRIRQRESRTGARHARPASARTDADGRFVYRLPRQTTSRTVHFIYPAGGTTVASASVTLRVRAAATIRVLLQGVTVRYRGIVRTAPIPRGGKSVFMQGRAPGTAWRTFAVRRTDQSGRFAGRYQLRVRRPGVRLQFRVKVPAQAGYPYVTGASGVVKRTVR